MFFAFRLDWQKVHAQAEAKVGPVIRKSERRPKVGQHPDTLSQLEMMSLKYKSKVKTEANEDIWGSFIRNQQEQQQEQVGLSVLATVAGKEIEKEGHVQKPKYKNLKLNICGDAEKVLTAVLGNEALGAAYGEKVPVSNTFWI